MTMFARIASVALAAILVSGIAATGASAEQRKKKWRHAPIYQHYYAGPEYVRTPAVLGLVLGGYELSREEFDQFYGDDLPDLDDDGFDESYYDPEVAEPKQKPKAKAAPRTVPKPVAKPAVKPAQKTRTTKVAATTTADEPAPAKPAAKTTKTALSCDKAGEIITGYGFSTVRPETCKGEVYAFNAMRDGKNFAIKVNATNGELTEVKKLQ